MKKIEINGKEVTTNFGEKGMHTLVVGNDFPNYIMELMDNRETTKQFFERLVDKGYTRIRFAEISTRIKGYHKTIAYCRR